MANIFCPICGEANQCMAETAAQGNCWCDKEGGFSAGIFDLVPPESRGKHCICKNCVDKYKKEEKVKKNSRQY